VYSTKLERAGELLTAAKQYLYWLQTPEGRHPEWDSIVFVRDNEKQLSVSANGKPPQTIFARPKNPDTCRGDAFKARSRFAQPLRGCGSAASPLRGFAQPLRGCGCGF